MLELYFGELTNPKVLRSIFSDYRWKVSIDGKVFQGQNFVLKALEDEFDINVDFSMVRIFAGLEFHKLLKHASAG